jgi:hypothetical protein
MIQNRRAKKLTTPILIILILAGSVSFLTIGFHVTNSTSDGNGNGGGNTTTSNKQTSSGLEENKLEEIASVPKCLGSALCPD